MNGIVLLLAAAVGVDYGWQADDQGELEYIIQVEPLLLETLKDGEEIVSRVPPDAVGLRSFRIRVGTGQLPREGLPPSEPAAASVQQPPNSQKNLRPESPFVPPTSQLSLPQFIEDAAVPEPLTPDPRSEPLSHQTASYSEADKTFSGEDMAGAAPVAQTDAPDTDASSPTASDDNAERRPWWPLTLTAMALFASVGLNFYLGLVARSVYRRYRVLIDDMRSAGSAAAGT
jgi:hypothetical protein